MDSWQLNVLQTQILIFLVNGIKLDACRFIEVLDLLQVFLKISINIQSNICCNSGQKHLVLAGQNR